MRRKSVDEFLNPYKEAMKHRVYTWKRLEWKLMILSFRRHGDGCQIKIRRVSGNSFRGASKTERRKQWKVNTEERMRFYLHVQRACLGSLAQAVEEISTNSDAGIDDAIFAGLFSEDIPCTT